MPTGIADLTGMRAFVTGAGTAGGMGATIAEVLARQGAAVALGDLDLERTGEVARAIEDVETIGVELDVGSPSSVTAAFATVLREWSRVDILVNNAGIAAGPGSTESEWEKTLNVNLMGVVRCCNAVLPPMKKRGYGKIVNLASISGHASRGTSGPYATSKGALLRYTKGLAVEVAPFSVNVNAVCPGAVWTGMQSRPFEHPEQVDARLTGLDPYNAFLEYYRPLTPLGRPQSADDVGKAVAFLCSDDAANITGQCLHVDGGAVIS